MNEDPVTWPASLIPKPTLKKVLLSGPRSCIALFE